MRDVLAIFIPRGSLKTPYNILDICARLYILSLSLHIYRSRLICVVTCFGCYSPDSPLLCNISSHPIANGSSATRLELNFLWELMYYKMSISLNAIDLSKLKIVC